MSGPVHDLLAQIPRPAGQRIALRVTPAAQRALRGGHPWLYAEAITAQSSAGQPGDLAVIFDERRRFLAIGLYDPTSPIRVRVLRYRSPEPIDRAWLAGRLTEAAAWRATLPETGTTGYRLVHGENDGLPGLVIDCYETALVAKLYSAAWIPWLADLAAALDEAVPARSLTLRLSRELARHPNFLYGLSDGATIAGSAPDAAIIFTENGLQFEADVVHGQKTGFFLDQRDNRARVGKLAAGRRVLNVFAYTGGFSVYAAAGGATEVVSLDASAPALAAAGRNFALNQGLPGVAAGRHTLLAGDAFDVLADLARQNRRYDLVIVDPPSLASQEKHIGAAVLAYARLTGLALGVLAPGGVLVQASCSAKVSAKEFFGVVNRAAVQAGRPLVEIDRAGHGIDHPVRFPEGAYLKCLFATAP
jgi:23S rRNA (cytosine1962-C5)-methyltransferase